MGSWGPGAAQTQQQVEPCTGSVRECLIPLHSSRFGRIIRLTSRGGVGAVVTIRAVSRSSLLILVIVAALVAAAVPGRATIGSSRPGPGVQLAGTSLAASALASKTSAASPFGAAATTGVPVTGPAESAAATVYGWGSSRDGELGDGTTTDDKLLPVRVRGLTGVTAIAGGRFSGYALRSNGTVYAWGYNSDGQLGDGTTTTRSTPVRVRGLTGVTAIAAGGTADMPCAVTAPSTPGVGAGDLPTDLAEPSSRNNARINTSVTQLTNMLQGKNSHSHSYRGSDVPRSTPSPLATLLARLAKRRPATSHSSVHSAERPYFPRCHGPPVRSTRLISVIIARQCSAESSISCLD